MNLSAIRTVFSKELTETLRDRRTIISMIVVPLVVMPALMFGFLRLSVAQVEQAERETHPIVLVNADGAPALAAALAGRSGLQVEAEARDFRARILAREVRAALELPDRFDELVAEGRPAVVTVHTYRGDLKSGLAGRAVEEFLDEYRAELVAARLAARQLPNGLTEPFRTQENNVAPPERVGGALFGGLVPYLILLLCLTGAIYPAIDLTAGEKERGTMETLLTSPVARIDILLGKLGVVIAAGLVSALISAGVLSVSLALGGSIVGGQARLDPMGVLASVALSVPLILLLTIGLLMLALFARSMKEAQSYISPLMIVVVAGALAALVPGQELSWTLALIPIVNVSVAAREMMTGTYQWPLLATIMATTLVYAGIALAACVRMFNRETVLFRS